MLQSEQQILHLFSCRVELGYYVTRRNILCRYERASL